MVLLRKKINFESLFYMSHLKPLVSTDLTNFLWAFPGLHAIFILRGLHLLVRKPHDFVYGVLLSWVH